jgi:hypothetical protein
VVLPAALLLSGASGGRSARAGHRGGATATLVLVLLRKRQGLLSESAVVPRGVDQSPATSRVVHRDGLRLLAALQEFVLDHRPHDRLTADATTPAWNGYLLTVVCSCGVVFERWITPEDAASRADRLGQDN